jgi:glycosyltransferase involved in cell wall biosynthesis
VKVLVLSHLFPRLQQPVIGRFVEDQVASLLAVGVAVDVVSAEFVRLGSDSMSRFLRSIWNGIILGRSEVVQSPLGIRFHLLILPGPRLGGGLQSLIYAFGFARFLKRNRDTLQFDLVHAHTGLLDGVAAMWASRESGKPFILSEHTGPYNSLFRSPGSKFLVEKVLMSASRVFAVSSSLKESMANEFPYLAKSISVLPNTYSSKSFQLKKRPDGLTIGWIGQVSEVKNFDLLLRVFGVLRNEKPEARLLLVTTSSARLLKEAAHRIGVDLDDRVEVVAARSREDVAVALSKMSVLAVSSRVETFSVATLEALAVGVPVVSTDCGGPLDIIQDEGDGVVLGASVTPEVFAKAVLDVINKDSDERRSVRSRSAAVRFDSTLLGKRLKSSYQDIPR